MSSKQPVFGCLSSTLLAGLGSVEIISNSDVSLHPHTTHTHTYMYTYTQAHMFSNTMYIHRYTTCTTYADKPHRCKHIYSQHTHRDTTPHIQHAHIHTYTYTGIHHTHTHLSHVYTDTHILTCKMHIHHRYNMHIHVPPQASSLLTLRAPKHLLLREEGELYLAHIPVASWD